MYESSRRNLNLSRETYRLNPKGGHQLHMARYFARHSGQNTRPGIPVFMLPGFLCQSDLYLPDEGEGLAGFLVEAGFDVYIAELRGKGESWPAVTRHSDTGVHQAITEDIPLFITQIARTRPDQPQLWVGQGFSSALLAATYARLSQLPAPVCGMIHFAATRFYNMSSWSQTLQYMFWQWRHYSGSLIRGYVQQGMGSSRCRESRQMFADLQQWHRSAEWEDPVDTFDYRQAIRKKGAPPSLYYALNKKTLWGSLESSRSFIRELGHHDARLVGLGKASGNKRNYRQYSMINNPDARDDHFQGLLEWAGTRIHSGSSACAA